VAFNNYDYTIDENVYENLLWYSGTNSTAVVPWLAQSYTESANQTSYQFTLRSGIKFADGEPFNSSAVYFSLNLALIEDGSYIDGHGVKASFILQQLENESLATAYCGCTITYNKNYVDSVLAQNFVQITGPDTFNVHILSPNAAFAFTLAAPVAEIVAPVYVMQHDLAMWNNPSTGYTLPYPNLSGNLMEMMNQYFQDEAATCNSGVTPGGCAQTYLGQSLSGSLAGTGPYTLVSFNPSTDDIVLAANANYWGGPGPTPIHPTFEMVEINYVPSESTRILDLKSAGASGVAMMADITPDQLYAVADRSAWLNNHTLSSIIPGVSLFGPYSIYDTWEMHFVVNVTDPYTGTPYKFQPWADLRFRLAFADSVNMNEINLDVGNGLYTTPNQLIPPGLPPAGAYNTSVSVPWHYDPAEAQNLLLSAMEHPITQFTLKNGAVAPPGEFNNTFGCTSLGKSGTCNSPVPQTIVMNYITGRSVDEAVETQMAQVINNISATYNMGLSVVVQPLPNGQYGVYQSAGEMSTYQWDWIADYPYALDFLGPTFVYPQAYPGADNWNITQMAALYSQLLAANANGNVAAFDSVSAKMNTLANSMVMDFWTYYPDLFFAVTSNVQGFIYNPSIASNCCSGPPFADLG